VPAAAGSGDSLRSCWSTIKKVRDLKPSVKHILMCPITQLSQSSEFRSIPDCVVLSRPARASHMYKALHRLLRDVSREDLDSDLLIAPDGWTQRDSVPDAGIKVLIWMQDADQRMVLKAMLTRDIHQCFFCEEIGGLPSMLKHHDNSWSHHVLFLGCSSVDDASRADVIRIVQKIRKVETDSEINPTMSICGVLDAADPELEKVCLSVGFNKCIVKPLKRQEVNEIVDEKQQLVQSVIIGRCAAKKEEAESHLEAAAGQSKTRVLVVDDDSGQRMVLKSMLTKEGFDVDTAEDGVQAVRAAARFSYDLVLMDGFMPNKTGWEATADIRAAEKERGATRQLTIIGVTGATSTDDEVKCRNAGMSDIITKPVKREMLRSKVQEWVKKGLEANEGGAGAGSSRSLTGTATKAVGGASGAKTGTHCMVLSSDKGQRTVLKGMLKMMGIVAHVAGDEEEALQVTKDVSLDWIMIDTTVAATLRQVGEIVGKIRQLILSSKPIFALSDSDDYDGLMEAGFDEVVKKPLDRRDLSTLLARRTTFAGKGSEAAVDAARPSPAAPAGADGKADQLRVLVVEDHWANRRLLEAMLLKQGHVMEAVENGLEAVNITGTRKYDMILMDCNMPIMDGWQATEKIRKVVGPNQATPIVAVTANAMKGDRDKCLQSGMDDYLSKPVDRKRLIDMLSKWTADRPRVYNS